MAGRAMHTLEDREELPGVFPAGYFEHAGIEYGQLRNKGFEEVPMAVAPKVDCHLPQQLRSVLGNNGFGSGSCFEPGMDRGEIGSFAREFQRLEIANILPGCPDVWVKGEQMAELERVELVGSQILFAQGTDGTPAGDDLWRAMQGDRDVVENLDRGQNILFGQRKALICGDEAAADRVETEQRFKNGFVVFVFSGAGRSVGCDQRTEPFANGMANGFLTRREAFFGFEGGW